MRAIWDYLKGKKTYLVALAYGAVIGLETYGLIDPQLADALKGLLVALGGITLRMGMHHEAERVAATVRALSWKG